MQVCRAPECPQSLASFAERLLPPRLSILRLFLLAMSFVCLPGRITGFADMAYEKYDLCKRYSIEY